VAAKVFIIESSYPVDYYSRQLDGIATRSLLDVLQLENRIRMVLDKEHFQKGLDEASANGYRILHLSCHGDEDGIALANNYQPTWDEFADFFQNIDHCPTVLVMSACAGACKGIADAFRSRTKRPAIIFGSVDERTYAEYATAWAILYHCFKKRGINTVAAQTALKQISVVVSSKFRYRRWSAKPSSYRVFPGANTKFEIKMV